MLEIIVNVFQMILALGSFLISYLLLKKNKSYLGNQLLALALSLVGFYAIVLFLYKVFDDAVFMQFSIRAGFISLMFAVFFLFTTMQVIIHSSKVIKGHPVRFLLLLFIVIIISGFMIFSDWIYVENNDISTMDYKDTIFFSFAAYIGMMIILTMLNLYIFGIRKSPADVRKKMWFFFSGLCFMLLGLITEGIGGAVEGLVALFDILLFMFLSIGVILMAKAFL